MYTWAMHIDEDRLYQLVGQEFRRRRLKLGMTQADLANVTEELRTSITNIEAGRQRPPLHVLYRICAALGLEPGEMLPLVADIAVQPDIPVRIEALEHPVPPLTAAFVQDILRSDGRSDEDRSRQ